METIYNNEKIPTGILGMDRLLFGGIQLQSFLPTPGQADHKALSIVIKGGNGTSRALFSMQLLHGITKSLYKLFAQDEEKLHLINELPSVFYSPNKDGRNLQDMLLDTLISQSVNDVIEESIKGKREWIGCKFCSAIFDLKSSSYTLPLDFSKLDQYLSEEAAVYNNRTNALHWTVAYRPNDVRKSNDTSNLIAFRQFDTIEEYSRSEKIKELGEMSEDYFNLSICTDFGDLRNKTARKSTSYIPCVVVDGDNNRNEKKYFDELSKRTLVIISILDDNANADLLNPDMLIEMRCHTVEENKYVIHQLCIQKSVLQATALGWHQYKKRDYGIEIYPSTHVLLQRRRHMPKALLRGHLNVLTETYQQFIDCLAIGEEECTESVYTQYASSKVYGHWGRLRKIYHTLQNDIEINDVLRDILIEPSSKEDPEGRVTVIIGEANTYKRYLSLGSTFSASSRKEHTLNVLLDQEYYTMRKRMACPTWTFKTYNNKINCKVQSSADCESCNQCNLPNCYGCFSYLHFWDLRMGCITPAEFFYYLIRQINIFAGPSRELKRIVIDDIQKIDYSFPLLAADKLFLTTLISICKDYNIDLFILCDKHASLVNELRSLADNVICTERVEDELRLYIEHYAGYNAPSHIFGCRIQKIEKLFYCKNDKGKKSYFLNENSLESIYVPNMDHFWVCCDTNKITNALKKR